VVWADPSASGAGQRFIDPVFDEVEVISDIHYRTAPDEFGDPVDLALDIYQPVGDTAENRPLILWMFGGGFVSGAKDGPLEQIMGQRLASLGYAVASIDYRLSSTTNLPAIVRAYEDAHAALAWLRDHAEDYGIDPGRVASSGMSAGAITALNTAYVPDRSAGEGTSTDPSHVDAVLSFAGITIGGIEPGEPNMFMAHGTPDVVVPYFIDADQCDQANAVGVECILDAYPGFGHVDVLVNLDEILSKAMPWLYGELDLANWTAQVAQPPVSSTDPTDESDEGPAAADSTDATTTVAESNRSLDATSTPAASAVTATPSLTG
jgi:hypothetical protein